MAPTLRLEAPTRGRLAVGDEAAAGGAPSRGRFENVGSGTAANGRAGGAAAAAAGTFPRLVLPPPYPNAVPKALSARKIRDALAFNRFRFKDQFSVVTLRRVIGAHGDSGLVDRDLVLKIAVWQAKFGLEEDGKAGPKTTATVVKELAARRETKAAKQLRQDNYVAWTTVPPVVRRVPSAIANGPYRWDVKFTTSLRNGWIIQRMDNTWRDNSCGGPLHPRPPTPRYWEAWWVDRRGRVRIPTSLATPPTHRPPGRFHDRWRRVPRRGTWGAYTINAQLFTTLRLPPGFSIGTVPDAGRLPATLHAPDTDRLGPAVARRSASGAWDGCPPRPPLFLRTNFHL